MKTQCPRRNARVIVHSGENRGNRSRMPSRRTAAAL